MPNIESVKLTIRKNKVFLLIDISQNSNPFILNETVRNIIEILKDVQEMNGNGIRTQICTMLIGEKACWQNECVAEYLEDYYWEDIETAGCFNLENGIELLNNYFEEGFSVCEDGTHPRIIMISNGICDVDSTKKIGRLYRRNVKIAVFLSESADLENLKNFTGNMEAVFKYTEYNITECVLKYIECYDYDNIQYNDPDEDSFSYVQGIIDVNNHQIILNENETAKIYRSYLGMCEPDDADKVYFTAKMIKNVFDRYVLLIENKNKISTYKNIYLDEWTEEIVEIKEGEFEEIIIDGDFKIKKVDRKLYISTNCEDSDSWGDVDVANIKILNNCDMIELYWNESINASGIFDGFDLQFSILFKIKMVSKKIEKSEDLFDGIWDGEW